jgi:16S rRNA (guanine966-N2)-methyltransferase
METRPTPARVREAMFNIWQGSIANCRWLDLCSGSGAMGAEALCRGALLVVGIEQAGSACGIIGQNWQKVAGANQRFQLIRGDVISKIRQLAGQKFDRIYFDPPYAANLYVPVLSEVDRLELLATNGELAVEHSPDPAISSLPTELPTLTLDRHKSYGSTAIAFYRLKEISNPVAE